MGRKKKVDKEKEKESEEKVGFLKAIKQETTEGIFAIIFILLSIFLGLARFGKAGIVGEKIYEWLTFLIGVGYYLLPVILLGLGVSFIKSLSHNLAIPKIISSGIFTLAGIGLIDLWFEKGGLIGSLLSEPLIRLFDYWFATIFLLAIIIISTLVLFDLSLKFSILEKLFNKSHSEDDEDEDLNINLGESSDEDEDSKEDSKTKKQNLKTVEPAEPEKKPEPKQEEKQNQTGLIFLSKKSDHFAEYNPPPLSLLQRDSGKPGVGDIKANANIIRRTLMNFGIQVEMDEISVGPSVTRYALKPAEGVKLSKIVSLQNDLSLALAAHPLRIEAPIPGKSLVGIEIPNSSKTTVGLGTLLRSSEFQESPKPLLLALGKGVSGQPYYTALEKMPHLLIAGATGAGKSVTVHALINSLLYRNSPETLKFIMVDPKRVELSVYNKIPHLLTPVIKDAKKTILALKWAAKEMTRRYDLLEEHKVRDIASYHKNILGPALSKAKKSGDTENIPEKMPFIVIIIDELADIMQAYPRELESGIVRLAQMSRAVGIHLIISTQRPSVNVITGLIKANIPARLALQVSSQIDSRTILDMPGAEKLLGAGDMLYLGAEMSQPQRIQSAYISEEELKKVTDYLSSAYNDELPIDSVNLDNKEIEKTDIFEGLTMSDKGTQIGGDSNGDDDEEDDMLEEAKQIVISAGKASTSYLQRKLRIGYSRAARIMDMLEEKGVIGPADGSKPREILNGGEDDTDQSDSDDIHSNNEDFDNRN